jgi:glyoxylase-like metal-dependent hydrolase (beta-lactamase superfamily II)
MKIKTIPTGAYEEICSIVWSNNNQVLIFDPGDDAELIAQTLSEKGLSVAAYCCTHAHADHINALAKLYAHFPAPILMHSADLKWAFSPVNQIPPHYPVPPQPQNTEILPLESQSEWTFSDLTFQVIQTPGHTPGCCCLYFPEGQILISGDTLFKGSCGRTDLPGGNPKQMTESLKILAKLPIETRVYPGHGPDTTIGLELQTNFFMKQH